MKNLIFIVLIFFIGGCAGANYSHQPVSNSLYLNKRYMKFVMDNGPSYKDKRLSNGDTIHYWRSDAFSMMGASFDREESPDYCELAIKTDAHNMIREISIIEDSIICGGIIK